MLVPGLDHRPDCFVFPCGQLASRYSQVWRNAWSLDNHPPADQTSHRLDATRELLFKLSMFKLSWRLESCLARTASLEAGPLGTPLMLLMKRPTAQGGMPLVFHIWALPKWAKTSHTEFRGHEARLTLSF